MSTVSITASFIHLPKTKYCAKVWNIVQYCNPKHPLTHYVTRSKDLVDHWVFAHHIRWMHLSLLKLGIVRDCVWLVCKTFCTYLSFCEWLAYVSYTCLCVSPRYQPICTMYIALLGKTRYCVVLHTDKLNTYHHFLSVLTGVYINRLISVCSEPQRLPLMYVDL